MFGDSLRGVRDSYYTTTSEIADTVVYIAPAASAVRYETIVYNTSTDGNRFTGAGPEVDKAWREISYDGEDATAPVHRLEMS